MTLQNIGIRVIQKEENAHLKDLVQLFHRVFEMEVELLDDSTYSSMLEDEKFFALVAEQEGILLGGMTFYLLNRVYNAKPWGYVMDLAVEKEFQRQGVGKKLMAFAVEFAKSKGADEVFVQAETADDYAVDFYRKTAPSGEMDVNHFFYKL